MKKSPAEWVAWGCVLAVLLICFLALGGCATDQGATKSYKPICDALGTPIRVNTKNTASPWHAGPLLAKRVYQQDDTALNLGCKGY